MNLILCGLPMSGKTTVGKLLAIQLGWNFIDTDRHIEMAYAKTHGVELNCRQIFQIEGEKTFRSIEKIQISALQGTSKNVIALGGGCVMEPENRSLLPKIGQIIYLQSSPKMLWKRVQQRGIPAYLDPTDPETAFYELAKKRMPIYQALASQAIEIDGLTPQDIVQAIEDRNKQ